MIIQAMQSLCFYLTALQYPGLDSCGAREEDSLKDTSIVVGYLSTRGDEGQLI